MRMRFAVPLGALACLLMAAHVALAASVSYAGGDGSSVEKAIIIVDAENEEQGVLAENAYVAKLHPDWRTDSSALIGKAGRYYDRNTYVAKDGSQHVLTFDVTGFLGKM